MAAGIPQPSTCLFGMKVNRLGSDWYCSYKHRYGETCMDRQGRAVVVVWHMKIYICRNNTAALDFTYYLEPKEDDNGVCIIFIGRVQ